MPRDAILLADAVFLTLLEGVFVGLYVDSEVVGCVNCEFIAD